MRLIDADEQIPMFGDGSTSRDYTYIDDIIDGVLAAFTRTTQAEDGFFRLYNLGGSKPVMLADMIAAIAEVVGKTPRIRSMPAQPGDMERTYADLTRSREELDFGPRTDFARGLEGQWAWLRERLDDGA